MERDSKEGRSPISRITDDLSGGAAQGPASRWSVQGVTRAYWVVLFVLAVLQGVSFYHLTRREEADRRQEASQQALLDLQKLLTDIEDAQAGERGFVLTGDPKFLTPYARAAAAAREEVGQLRSEAEPTAGASEQISRPALEALQEMDRVIAARKRAGTQPTVQGVGDAGQQTLERVRAAIEQVTKGQQEDTGQRSLEEAAAVRRGVVTYGLVSVADLALLVLGYWGLQRYVAHRRRVEGTLAEAWRTAEAAREEAEMANRAKDRILATVSHDLRTPLSGILLWTEVAQASAAEPEVREALSAISESAQAQARLVEDLLDASRTLGSPVRMDIERVNFAEVARKGCEAVRPTAEAKGVRLAVNVPEEAQWMVEGDRLRLQQVVWNLVGNAVKFTPEGGDVEVSLRREGKLVLSVRDTGRGIAAADLPHVFKPFFQAEDSGEARAGGVGLGLAIAKQLVERHGGTVEVASAGRGAGTTFTVMLPVAEEEREGATPVTIGDQSASCCNS